MSDIKRFSQQAKLGKNGWWRYSIGFFLILTAWIFIGSSLFVALQIYLIEQYANVASDRVISLYQAGEAAQVKELFQQAPPPLQITALLSTFVCGFLTLLFVVKFIHRRPIKSLITPYEKINYVRFFHGFAIFLASTIIVSVVGYFFEDTRGIKVTFNPDTFGIYLLIACSLLSIQIGFEELFIRGYLLQFLGLKIKNFISLAVTTTAIFTIFHLANPEVQAYGVWLIVAAYILPGLFFAAIALWDNRLELSLAAHFANNFFVLIILAPEVSALAGEPIFTLTEIKSVTIADCLSTLLQYGLFWSYFFAIGKNAGNKKSAV